MTDERFLPALLRSLGGLLVWAAHFLVIYGVTAIACARGAAALVPWAIGAATFAAVLATLFFMLLARREAPHFLDWLAWTSGALALLAIVWQSLPVLFVPPCG